jgi:hypothetical protein
VCDSIHPFTKQPAPLSRKEILIDPRPKQRHLDRLALMTPETVSDSEELKDVPADPSELSKSTLVGLLNNQKIAANSNSIARIYGSSFSKRVKRVILQTDEHPVHSPFSVLTS